MHVLATSTEIAYIIHSMLTQNQLTIKFGGNNDILPFTNAVTLSSITSTNGWNRNCRVYSEPMTSHALGELAGSWRTLLHMQ